MRTGIYIDGLNLYYGSLRKSPNKWLDIEKFGKLIVPSDDLEIIRYFTAIVRARPDDPQIPVRQETYLRALKTKDLVQIHTGRFTSRVQQRALADNFIHYSQLFTPTFRPFFLYSLMWKDKVKRRKEPLTKARVVINEEKGSDVNLGVHLLNDASRRLIDKAIVISNDSDLTEAIRLARLFDVSVGLLNPHPGPTSKHLKAVASFEIPFRSESLEKCQFPLVVIDKNGREIHKPKVWR